MIKIQGLKGNEKSFSSLRKIKDKTKSGIRKAFYDLGKDLKQESKRLITEPPKTGRIYLLRLKGRRVRHQASAAGEAPANFTGKLRSSVGYNVSKANEITFGAGDRQQVSYAKQLELGGGRIKPRPYLITSINNNEREAYEHLRSNLIKELG